MFNGIIEYIQSNERFDKPVFAWNVQFSAKRFFIWNKPDLGNGVAILHSTEAATGGVL